MGGGWQLAWQKDAKDGSLKRVYLKSEGGDLSNVTQNPAGFSGLVYFHGDHITFPVIFQELLLITLSSLPS